MPRRIFFLSIVLFLAIQHAVFAAGPQGFRIAGVVVDSVSGAPLEHAEVTIAPVTNLDNTITTLSSNDGQFLFSGLSPGKYRLTAMCRGYTRQGLDEHEGFMTGIAVGPKLDSEHIRFRLFRESVIAGNVSNESGEPVREAQVFLFQTRIFSGHRSTNQINRTQTDDLGNYRFAHLAPGVYSVVVYARPWFSGASNLALLFSLGKAALGDRIASVPLRMTTGVADFLSTSEFSHELPPQPPPNPILDVVYPVAFYSNAETLDAATPLSLSPGTTAKADFSLHAVPALRLLVKIPSVADAPAKPHSGDEDQASPDSTESFEASLNVAGVDLDSLSAQRSSQLPGFYEVSGIPPGQLVLTAGSADHGRFSSESQSLQVSSDAQIDMAPQGPLVSVSGHVLSLPAPSAVRVDDDDTSEMASIKFTSPDGRTSYSSGVGPKGEFAFSVPAGQYLVELGFEVTAHVASIEATGASVSGRAVALAAGTPAKLVVHLTQPNCTVTGAALKDGKPVAGAMILLVPEDPSQNATLFHRDQSDSDGTFTLGGVLPGRYTLLAIENGWDLEWSSLSVLFRYLPNGKPLDIKPGAQVSANPSVQ